MENGELLELREAFALALDCAASEREAFLRSRFAHAPQKAREVLSLLHHHESLGPFLDTTAAGPDFHVARIVDECPRDEALSFDGFVIERRIGVGGMGVVFAAKQIDPARRVAIKVLRDELAAPGMLDRFRKEIRVLARLQHPAIAPIYSAGTIPTPIGQRPYFVMRLVEGESLPEYAARHDLPNAERLALFLQLTAAVEHAHQQGVIHRDLKSAHILVETTAQAPRICVLDFGIARLINDLPEFPTLPGGPIGTVEYMSPEQARGERDKIDTRSDIYSLGVVLYELLTGRLPFAKADSLAESLRCIEKAPPVPLSRHDPRLAGALEAIVDCCLEKDKSRRYPSAGALTEDIHRYLRQEPVKAQHASAWIGVMLFARRHRTAVALSATSLGALLCLLAALLLVLDNLHQAYNDLDRRYESAFVRTQQTVRTTVEELAPLLGSHETQRRILEDARTTLDELLSERGNDLAVIALQCEVRLRISVLELDAGRIDLALAMRVAELPLARRLVEQSPDDIDFQRLLAINLVLVGDIHNEAGCLWDAEPFFNEAMNIFRRNAERQPNDARAMSELAWSCFRIGGLRATADERPETLALNREGAELAFRLASFPGQEVESLRLRWHFAWQRILICERSGDGPGRIRAFNEMIDIADNSLAGYASNRKAMECVLVARNFLAVDAEEAGNLDQAFFHRHRATMIARDITATTGNNELARLSYHQCLANEANVLAKSGRAREALDLLQPALNAAADRAATEPSSAAPFAEYSSLALPAVQLYREWGDESALAAELRRIKTLLPEADVFFDAPEAFCNPAVELLISEECAPVRDEVCALVWCKQVMTHLVESKAAPVAARQWWEVINEIESH